MVLSLMFRVITADPLKFDADLDPACPFDADPDPYFLFDANLDLDPKFQIKAQDL
jgi:hypothetical protein